MLEDYASQPLLGTTYPPSSKGPSPPIRSYLRRFLFPGLFLVLLIITALGGVRYRSQGNGALWGNDDYDVGYAVEGLDDGVMSVKGFGEKEVWRTRPDEILGEDALLKSAVNGDRERLTTLPAMGQELKDVLQKEEAREPLEDDGKSDKMDSEVEAKEEDAGKDAAILPVCKRTLSYRFYGKHGFGSQFSILLRVATIAKHFDYTFVVDSSEWNYGPWESYFLPLERNCRIENSRAKRIPAGDQGGSKRPAWTRENHVYWYHDVDGLDAFFLNLFVDSDALDQLHQEDRYGTILVPPLTPEETVPPVFHHAFEKLAETLREIWRVNEVIQEDSRELLRTMAVRREGEEGREAGDLRIAVHARLGDKYRESYKIGPSHEDAKGPTRLPDEEGSTLGSGQIKAYVLACTRAVNAILFSDRSTVTTDIEEEAEWKGRPVLVIMSDSPVAWSDFKSDPQTRRFDVIGTSRESQSSEEGGVDPFSKTNGFHETAFNSLTLEERISATRIFVRDVTVLAQNSDAFVMTGSSNVGRLMALLMGEEKVIRQGRMTSLDSRWFPTARFA